MGAIWQVNVKNTSGARVAVLTPGAGGYTRLDLTRRVNSPGAYALRMHKPQGETVAAFRTRMGATFGLDYHLEFYRAWPEMGIDWYLDFEAFHRGSNIYYSTQGELVYESLGVGYLDLLRRRIVMAASGTAAANKSGYAETVIKGYVDEQAGSGASSRAMSGLSVQTDAGQGNTVDFAACYDNLLELAQQVASVGGGDIDIIGTGAATFEFRWYQGQRGTDRSATLAFSYELGNMAIPRYSTLRDKECNSMYIAGQGEGEARTRLSNTTDTLADDSPWNICERFIDARDVASIPVLVRRTYITLDKFKPEITLSFEPAQVPGCLLGKDYFFGDLATVQFMGYEAQAQVASYSVTASETGEKIDVDMKEV